MSESKFVGEPVAADDACNWYAPRFPPCIILRLVSLCALHLLNILLRYSETQGDGLIMQFRVQCTLHRCQTKFQQLELLQTEAFGRCLVLDGQMQSSQLDEAM